MPGRNGTKLDESICAELRGCKSTKEIVARGDLIQGLVAQLGICEMKLSLTESVDRDPKTAEKRP